MAIIAWLTIINALIFSYQDNYTDNCRDVARGHFNNYLTVSGYTSYVKKLKQDIVTEFNNAYDLFIKIELYWHTEYTANNYDTGHCPKYLNHA